MNGNVKEYPPIVSLRGIFAVLMLVHHMCPMFGIPYALNIGDTIVLFFFVLSGFHIGLSYKDKIDKKNIFRLFMNRRMLRIFPLHWLTLGFCIISPIYLLNTKALIFQLTLTQSIIPNFYYALSYNGSAWFLSSIFFCYILSIPILRFINRHFKVAAIYIAFYAIALNYLIYISPQQSELRVWLCYISPFGRILDYTCGILFAYVWSENKDIITTHDRDFVYWTVIELIALLAIIFTMVYYDCFESFNNHQILRYPVVLTLIFVTRIASGGISYLLANKYLNRLGHISMEIYLIHLIVLYHIKRFSGFGVATNVLLAFIITLSTSYVVSKYYQPFSTKWLKKWAYLKNEQ